MMRFARRLFLICPLSCVAWSATLSLSPGPSAPGRSVSLSLSLASSGTSVAGAEWASDYSTGDFASINITAGSSVAAASKQLSCSNPAAGQYVCLVSGLNQDVIPNGVLATAVLNVASTSTSTSSNIGVGGPSATDFPALITTQAAPPTAPANLTGVATSPSQIKLSWTV